MPNQLTAGLMVTPKLRLVRPLGAGGMGSVWLAEHLALHTQVVVKFIADELADNSEAIARFEREAAAASQVKSPHVVQMLDHGVMEDGIPFIVMELLEGQDLAGRLEAHGRMPVREVSAVVTQLSRALVRAHESGIVHRDIKPQNIFLCDAGDGDLFVKLLDFGIAKGADVQRLDGDTKTGSLVGSPYYMSPEQLLGSKDIDHRTDLWSVGVVAFEAMTGIKPFDAETVGGLALKIHNEPLPKPSTLNANIPAAVDEWFGRACARDAKDRFQNAKEMADALTVAATGQVPAMAISAPSSAPPSLDAMALARTAVDPMPSVPPVSAHDARVLTYGGVATTKPPPGRSRALVVAGLIALGIGGGLAIAAFARKGTPDRALADPGQPAASSGDTASGTPAAPETTVITPIAPLVSLTPAPSATATEAPAPTHHHVVVHTHVATTASASAAPHPSTKPTATAPPVSTGSDDDIR